MLQKLTFDKRYIPQQEMVVRQLFATAAEKKGFKSMVARTTIENIMRLGRSTSLVPCIEEFVDYSRSMVMNTHSAIKSKHGKEYLLALADKASPESINSMLEAGIL